MVIGKIAGALRPGEANGGAKPPGALTPELGAAGLIVLAAHRDGVSTEVERQSATAALMKLLHIAGPRAAALRADAEALPADPVLLADAAAGLPADDREQLVTCLWALGGAAAEAADGALMRAVASSFGLTHERLLALRPREA